MQSIDLAVEAERLGVDGAYFRVHHFARQLASPFPLLAAVGARTKKIEIGSGVIDMRYENPHYMAEDAGSADLISGGRLPSLHPPSVPGFCCSVRPAPHHTQRSERVRHQRRSANFTQAVCGVPITTKPASGSGWTSSHASPYIRERRVLYFMPRGSRDEIVCRDLLQDTLDLAGGTASFAVCFPFGRLRTGR